MKKIIVPLDFSEHSEFALKTAAKLAAKNDAEIIALHMLELSDAVLTKNESEHQQKMVFFLELAKKRFEEFLQKEYLQNVAVIPLVKHFKVFSEVNDVAISHSADIIVMGSHGSHGAKEFFVGSNTERVVRHSEIPVLVVKSEVASVDFKTVLFATDFDEESIPAYKKARKLFETLGTHMIMLYVNLPNEKFRSTNDIDTQIHQFLMKSDGHVDHLNQVAHYSDYSVESGVLNYAKKVNADILAIPTHGRKGLSHFFSGSIGEDLANHAKLPVMTFRI